jgi:hypothetical protein
MVRTLRVFVLSVAAIAASLPAEAGIAGDDLTSAISPPNQNVFFMELPVVNPDGSTPDGCPFTFPGQNEEREIVVHRIDVDGNGNTIFNGQVINDQDLAKIFRGYLVHDGLTELQLMPNAQANAKSVINMLGAVAESDFPCLGFVGNERYREIYRSKASKSGTWTPPIGDISRLPNRAPSFDPIVVYITSTDAAGREPDNPDFAGSSLSGRCRAYFGNKAVSGSELVKLATATMKNAVEDAGGAEKLLGEGLKPGILPDGLIMATPNTPWRCVGGVVYNLQRSGFVGIGITLAPN